VFPTGTKYLNFSTGFWLEHVLNDLILVPVGDINEDSINTGFKTTRTKLVELKFIL
jgi:hypothetical protein